MIGGNSKLDFLVEKSLLELVEKQGKSWEEKVLVDLCDSLTDLFGKPRTILRHDVQEQWKNIKRRKTSAATSDTWVTLVSPPGKQQRHCWHLIILLPTTILPLWHTHQLHQHQHQHQLKPSQLPIWTLINWLPFLTCWSLNLRPSFSPQCNNSAYSLL